MQSTVQHYNTVCASFNLKLGYKYQHKLPVLTLQYCTISYIFLRGKYLQFYHKPCHFLVLIYLEDKSQGDDLQNYRVWYLYTIYTKAQKTCTYTYMKLYLYIL